MTNKLDCLKLINFIEKSTFFTTNKIQKKKILIAFSGGQDSTCLLTIFYILSKKWGFELGAVYCNHCWKNATETSLKVFENLQLFDIPFYFVEAPNSNPMKPEQQARNWRYSSFYKILKKENYDFLLTGHTLSDCVETSLFNLFRGSGLKGICSLKEFQTFQKFKKTEFFFKKTIFFSDPFFYFTKKNENLFLRKYKFFKNCCTVKKCKLFNPIRTNFLLTQTCSNQPSCDKNQAVFFVFLKKTYFSQTSCGFYKPQNFFDSVDFRFRQLFYFLSKQKKSTKLETLKLCLNFYNKSTFEVLERENINYLVNNKQSFKARGRKRIKLNNNLFYLYLKKLKEFQKIDKLSSFITLFKPAALRKNGQKKKFFNRQIQRIIRKKEKEKAICTLVNFDLVSENKNLFFQSLLVQNHFKNMNYPEEIEFENTKKKFLIFRPFLKINREILFLFSKNLKLYFHYDNSNKDLNLTRNFIRKVLIPLIKKINPRVEENIYKFSKIIEFYSDLVIDLKLSPDRFDIFRR